MCAERQGWPLAGIDVTLTYIVKDKSTRRIDRLITLHGVNDEHGAKLAEIAEKTRSPGRPGPEPRSAPPPASDD